MKNNNFLNIQSPQECLTLIEQLPSLDEKTQKKHIAGIGAYFQGAHEMFTTPQIEQFFETYPSENNMRFSLTVLEPYVQKQLKNKELPRFLMDLKKFSPEFKKYQLFDFLDLVMEKGSEKQQHYYLEQHKTALENGIVSNKITQSHLLAHFIQKYPASLAGNTTYSDAKKLKIYQNYFAKTPNIKEDLPVLRSIFKSYPSQPVRLGDTIRAQVWDMLQERLEFYRKEQQQHKLDKINFSLFPSNNTEDFTTFISLVLSSNFDYLNYCQKTKPELLQSLLNSTQKTTFHYEDYSDNERTVHYYINCAQAIFIHSGQHRSVDAQTHTAQQNFYNEYETYILEPVVQEKKFRQQSVSLIELLFEEDILFPIGFVKLSNLNAPDFNSVIAMAFARFYETDDANKEEEQIAQKILQATPIEIIKNYQQKYQQAVAENQQAALSSEKQTFLHILLERAELGEHLEQKTPDTEDKRAFKL